MARTKTSDAPPAAGPTSAARVGANHWVVPLTLVMALLYGLAAAAIELVLRLSPQPPGGTAIVTFTQGATYDDALDLMTSLGLRIDVTDCVEVAIQFGDTNWNLARNLQYPEGIFAAERYLAVATRQSRRPTGLRESMPCQR